MMLLPMMGEPLRLKMPPPKIAAELPKMVLLAMVGEPLATYMPPPSC